MVCDSHVLSLSSISSCLHPQKPLERKGCPSRPSLCLCVVFPQVAQQPATQIAQPFHAREFPLKGRHDFTVCMKKIDTLVRRVLQQGSCVKLRHHVCIRLPQCLRQQLFIVFHVHQRLLQSLQGRGGRHWRFLVDLDPFTPHVQRTRLRDIAMPQHRVGNAQQTIHAAQGRVQHQHHPMSAVSN